MENLIQAARDVIAAMNLHGGCPRCMADLQSGEEHVQDVNGAKCPYDALARALKADLGPAELSYCAHDGKYYVWKIDQDAEPIPADEPVFVLRAQDRYAAITVRDYTTNRWRSKGDNAFGNVSEREAWDQVINIAKAMDAWPFHKEPD